MTTAALDLPDLTGRLAVVTGANSGIGLEAARRLAGAGAEVVLACRNPQRGAEAVADVRGSHPMARVSTTPLDLSSLASVESFSSELLAAGRPLHLLVNNAGVMAIPARETTVDGFELQLGTNYLGHFALTARLLPLLRQAPDPVVVSLSSLAHLTGRIDLADLQSNSYGPWKAYGQSKLAMLMFALHLHRLGLGVRSNAAHPGFTRTHLQSSGPMHNATGLRKISAKLTLAGMRLPFIAQEAAQGALPTLLAATSPFSGAYFGPGGPGEMTGAPKQARMRPKARDVVIAQQLFAASEQLTGVALR
jgi:NAD(P)-dependent dehydrogenase (short-subunit alcohol dehydrogenase family)